MSSYNELVKNFERVRAYMREFYVYGFKSRDGYDKKSSRSYDDERRRMESWLGDHMSFVRTPEGKNVFISIDSRTSRHNPFYKAWKSKSFTDGDITLHFILFDILHSPDIALSVKEIVERIDGKYLSQFASPMMFDESTVRKKLKEYCGEGIVVCERVGRNTLYRRSDKVDLPDISSALDFYSEIAPCGVVGSFLLDKAKRNESVFTFKHHYITSAMDSDVLAALFSAMREKRVISVYNKSRRRDEPRENRVVPLRIFVSVQSGRQHLLAYQPEFNCIKSFRVDYLSNVKLLEETPRFDELRAELTLMQSYIWGVCPKNTRLGSRKTEHVEFDVRIEADEDYIVKRLLREKRIGSVVKLDDRTYRFSADVYDTGEMIPWIRTFICRIVRLQFSNRSAEIKFREDLHAMYRMYGLSREARYGIQ